MKNVILTLVLTVFLAISGKTQIVYTDVDPDTTIFCPASVPYGSDSSQFFYFDLNLDDTIDFRVEAQHYTFYENGWHDGYQIFVLPLNNNKCAWGYLIDNDTISDNLYWQNSTSIDWGGGWSYPSEGYVGLKLQKNNLNYFGWVKVDWFDAWKITIKEFAYNSVASQLIFAGQTTGIENIYDTSNVNIFVLVASLYVNFTTSNIPSGTIEVYNISGQQIKLENITSTVNSINVSDCTQGTYIVKVICDDFIITKTIVID